MAAGAGDRHTSLFIWPLQEGRQVTGFCHWQTINYTYGSRALSPPCSNPDVLAECSFESDKERETLMSNICHRLTPHPVKIRADIEVSCYSYEGIDAVKTALKAGLAQSTEELPIKV